MRIRFLPGALLVLSTVSLAAVPEGIPRELARQRAAAISDVRYRLWFTLDPKAATVRGMEVLQFRLQQSQDILLDYRDGKLSRLSANGGINLATKAENGHLVLLAQ